MSQDVLSTNVGGSEISIPIDPAGQVSVASTEDPGAAVPEEVDAAVPEEVDTAVPGDVDTTGPEDPETAGPEDAVGPDEADAAELRVSLPVGLELSDAHVADDGTVVYLSSDGAGVDVAVQALDDGTVRLQTIMSDQGALQDFTYEFEESTTLYETADGRIIITYTTAGGTQTISGEVGEAWAVDANGDVVDTSYRVEGNTLVQVVTPDQDTTFPVVADPVLVGVFSTYGDYVHYSYASGIGWTASAHGWWTKGSAKATTARVTIRLQAQHSGKWHNIGNSNSAVLPPGSGSRGKKVTMKAKCWYSTETRWRSVVDVDLVGYLDSPEKLYTASRALPCGVNW